jgi:formate dehydrogenase subunit gamma
LSRFSPWKPEVASEIIAAHKAREGALLPILHDLQHAFGWTPEAAVPMIAEALNLSRAEVHGVISFYPDFRHEPAGRTVLKLCQAEACQARGSRALAAHAEARLGVAMGGATADGRMTLEPVYCLGLCASGPSAMVDERPVARLDPAKLDRLIDEVAS